MAKPSPACFSSSRHVAVPVLTYAPGPAPRPVPDFAESAMPASNVPTPGSADLAVSSKYASAMESGEILHMDPRPIRVAGPLPRSGEARLNILVTESSASRWTPAAISRKYALHEWARAVL